jgi:DNA-binding transcriptional LysR family regulator
LRPSKRGSRRARWVALLCPSFFRTYRDISVDLHLTNAHADLIGDGFDAAFA